MVKCTAGQPSVCSHVIHRGGSITVFSESHPSCSQQLCTSLFNHFGSRSRRHCFSFRFRCSRHRVCKLLPAK
ncbi:hypothetical protein GGE12_006194 [Rhizobium mongolense]|uniref:Uncharacterized protein n=1 Tax=Rhizobium mongolense TaxID=57676 RepID=A0A7W6RTL7_9HYPH|nr:hypothetical protein [Rhizobium mongolense]